ncbi:MAG: hemerythrin domain-containing protein, partial [Bacteroidota bacterium]
MEYLRHAHYQFIKERLPFITYIAKNCESIGFNELLSEFVEDFIKHIYEEEDSVFRYVKVLRNIKKGVVANPMKELIPYRKFSLKHEMDHHDGDDEMKAIRSLIESIVPVTLKERVLVNEVKALDRELLYHAEIENKIFFPKAIELESEVNNHLKSFSRLN